MLSKLNKDRCRGLSGKEKKQKKREKREKETTDTKKTTIRYTKEYNKNQY